MNATFATPPEGADRSGQRSNRRLLKRLTRTRHERAELHWTTVGAFRDASAYREFLNTMLQIHCRFGSAAAAMVSKEDVGWEHGRTSALCSDLKLTGRSSEPSEPGHITRDFAWGVLYVLNGSAMGASVLLNSKAIDQNWPTAYLESMREFARTGALGTFFRALNAASLDFPQTVLGAEAIFDAVAGMDEAPRAAEMRL